MMKRTLVSLVSAVSLWSTQCDNDKLTDAECLYRQQNVREECNNVDDDCDGMVDTFSVDDVVCGPNGLGMQKAMCIEGEVAVQEECPDMCPLGAEGTFYVNAPETKNVGVCHEGKLACVATQDGAIWKMVVPAQGPTAELCNYMDDDCDGRIDDNCVDECIVGEKQTKYSGLAETRNVGECREAIMECKRDTRGVALWNVTRAERLPQQEECENFWKDQNCNGVLAKDEVVSVVYLLFLLDNSGSFADHNAFNGTFVGIERFVGKMESEGRAYRYAAALVPAKTNESNVEVIVNYRRGHEFLEKWKEWNARPARNNEIFYDALKNAADNKLGLTPVPAGMQEKYVVFTDMKEKAELSAKGYTEEEVAAAVVTKAAEVSVFVPTMKYFKETIEFFDKIVTDSGGNFYEMNAGEDAAEDVIGKNLENIVKKCK